MMSEHEKEDTAKDINEVFDDILLSEEKLIEESFQEGYKIGVAQGNPEGFHLGYHRGAELGAEIGYYTGVTESYLQHLKPSETSEKSVRALENLKELLDKFPRDNAEDVDIAEEANKIRAKFKKICAQLKVDIAYPETDKLSF